MFSETVIPEFKTQQVPLGVTAERLGPVGMSKLYSGVWVKAAPGNTDAVYVGMGDQVAVNGYELLKGESIMIPIDLLDKIWAVAASGTPAICLLFA